MNNIFNSINFNFKAIDDVAITIFLIGFGVVFLVLIILSIVFILFPKLLNLNLSFKTKKNKPEPNINEADIISVENIDDENIYAAIALTLHKLSENLHDQESLILTIKPNNNSAWNSKIRQIK